MGLKNLSTKITSWLLLIFSLYQTFLSLRSIFFIYPELDRQSSQNFFITEGLIEKALIIWATMITSGVTGFLLLFKREEDVRIFHIIFGLLIFLAASFFTVKVSFNQDPVFNFLSRWVDRWLTNR